MMSRVELWTPDTTPLGPAVVAIGVFDGVHLGHQALVRDGCRSASAHGVPCVALTFDRDPDQVVTPDNPSPQLLTLADKCRFLKDAGAGHVSVIPFDTEVAFMSPERFVDRVLRAVCTPIEVHVGVDFRFGRFAEGDVDDLRALGRTAGFEVVAHDLITLDSSPITSTRIRALIAEGSLDAATLLLGRPHRVAGMVVRGRGEGMRMLGVPTANILPAEHAALPPAGVYSGWATHAGSTWPSAISVGVPPSFPQAHHVLEAHLVGFEGDLLHHELVMEFAALIRPQKEFADVEQLASAMRNDISRVESLLNTHDRGPS